MNNDRQGTEDNDIKSRAKVLAAGALGRRVTPSEWKVALEVAEFILWQSDAAKVIPLRDALQASVHAIKSVGHEIVPGKHLSELLSALDDFGMNKSFPTDSPKLRAVKEALSRFRFTPRLF